MSIYKYFIIYNKVMKKSFNEFISPERYDDTVKSKSQSILSSDTTIPEKIIQLKNLLPDLLRVQFDTDPGSMHDFVQAIHQRIIEQEECIAIHQQTVWTETLLLKIQENHALLTQLYELLSSPDIKIVYLTEQIRTTQWDINKLIEDKQPLIAKIEAYQSLDPLFDIRKLIDGSKDHQQALAQQSDYQKTLSHKELYSASLNRLLNRLSLWSQQAPWKFSDILKDISPIESFEEWYDASASSSSRIPSSEDKKIQKIIPVVDDIALILSDLWITKEYVSNEDNAVRDEKKDLLYIFLHDRNLTVSCSNRFGIGTVVYKWIVSKDDIENLPTTTLKEKYKWKWYKLCIDGDQQSHNNMLERVRETIEEWNKNISTPSPWEPQESQNVDVQIPQEIKPPKEIIKIIPKSFLPQSSEDIVFGKEYTAFVSSITVKNDKRKINIILWWTSENPVRWYIPMIPELKDIKSRETVHVELAHIHEDSGHMRFQVVYED